MFKDLDERKISNLIKCNELSVIRIIKKYCDRLMSKEKFHCGVMVSIAGHISSPYFSVYGAPKMAFADL